MEERGSPLYSQPARRAESANRLVTTFSYLCPRGARKFVRSGLDRSDLEQVAALGLIKASRRYDASAKTPFEAYAWVLIVGELMHYVRDYEHMVRVPRRLLALEREVMNAHESLVAELWREPTENEVARRLGVTLQSVAKARRARGSRNPIAIDDANSAAIAVYDRSFEEDRITLRNAFAALGGLESRIVAGVYLLGLTQSQLAKSLDLHPKSVSRLHLQAIATMRRRWIACTPVAAATALDLR